jgi:cyclophilin family peptidyl-prolyl cis-trans isomerase
MLRIFDFHRWLAALLACCVIMMGHPGHAQPEDDATADSTAAAEAYAAKYEQWKSMIRELRELRVAYSEAEDEQGRSEIRQTFDETIARCEALMPELRTAAMAAYAASTTWDRELENLLTQMLTDDARRDRFEEAVVLAKNLLDNGCEIGNVYAIAGLAAFATNDYDNAETYLKKAEEEGTLDASAWGEEELAFIAEKGREFLNLLPTYKTYWEEEQKIRAEETAADDLPQVLMRTSKGDIKLELFENQAPQTVANFIHLIEDGFYENLSFHRVLPHFMAQGGCPLGDGTGGPGYNIACECYKDDYRKHFRGTLSMAHAGRDTGGSQFFLTFVPTPHLNGRHTAFGRVIEGMDVLAKLQRIDPDETSPNPPDPDKILAMEVLRKRDHEYKPTKVQ